MTRRVQVIGSYVSPYVRKVLVVCHLKGIDYEIDPIVPFFGDDRFARLSPLRRIPGVYLAPHNANASQAAADRVHANTIRHVLESLDLQTP